MTVTDPTADVLMCLRNVNRAYHDTVSMSYSRPKNAVANMLVEEGYFVSTSAEDACVGRAFTLILKYGSYREPAVRGLQCTSKPGLRMHVRSTNLSRVRSGLGVVTLPTPSGLLTDCQAADKGVGGEVLIYIW